MTAVPNQSLHVSVPNLGDLCSMMPPPPAQDMAERVRESRRHHRLEQAGVDWVHQLEVKLDEVEKKLEKRPREEPLLRRRDELLAELQRVPWRKKRFGPAAGCSSADCGGRCGAAPF